MKRIPCAAFMIAILCASLSALEWPTDTPAIAEAFAQNTGDGPSFGTSFTGPGPIRATSGGEVIYARQRRDLASGLPSGLGAWMAIDHADGLISVYGRLDAATLLSERTMVERSSLLGYPAHTGPENQIFYFSLIDRTAGRYVNPAILMSRLLDEKQPTIRTIRLADSEGQALTLPTTRYIKQGEYNIFLDTYDQMGETKAAHTQQIAPVSISCLLDGEERFALDFETLQVENGLVYLETKSKREAKEVYEGTGEYHLGKLRLTRGKSVLQLIVRDIAGNERNVSYLLNVE